MKLLCIFTYNFCCGLTIVLHITRDKISGRRECFHVLCWLHCWILSVWVLFKFWSSSTRILLKSFQGEFSIGKAKECFQSRVIVFWILWVSNSIGCFLTCGLSPFKCIQDCLCTSTEVAGETQDVYVNYCYTLDNIQNIFHSNVWTLLWKMMLTYLVCCFTQPSLYKREVYTSIMSIFKICALVSSFLETPHNHIVKLQYSDWTSLFCLFLLLN